MKHLVINQSLIFNLGELAYQISWRATHLSNVIKLPNVDWLLFGGMTASNPAWFLGYFDLSTKSVDNPVSCPNKWSSKPWRMGVGLKMHYFGWEK